MGDDGRGEHDVAGENPERVERNGSPRSSFRKSSGEFAAQARDPAQVSRPLGEAVSPRLRDRFDADPSADDPADNRGRRIGVAATADYRPNRRGEIVRK